ncbi:MAG: SlyX family protein, partial [Burkholderiales bacterium]
MDRPDPVDARLTELEIKASLAEDTVDHLNEVVIAQQARIDALVHEVARLARLLREGGGDAPASRGPRDEIPPHYCAPRAADTMTTSRIRESAKVLRSIVRIPCWSPAT